MAHLVTGYAGQAHIKSADDGAFNASFFGDGQYVMEAGNCFEGSIIDNNTVRILDGNGMMYGRHFMIDLNSYEDMTITTGTAGMNRCDLICATYTKDEATGIENLYLQVIKGTETTGTAVIPAYTDGNILEGATFNQMPLYKVIIEGVVLKDIVPLFTIIPTYKTLAEKYRAEFIQACQTHLNSLGILDTMEEINANTQENQLAGALAVKELGESLASNDSSLNHTNINGIGWKRIAKYQHTSVSGARGSSANCVELIIKRTYGENSNEYHHLQLLSLYFSHEFKNLYNASSEQLFTKIRLVLDSANSCSYIEVYYAKNNANHVSFILNNGKDYSGHWGLITPQAVTEDVGGMEVLTSTDIPANSDLATDLDLANYLPLIGGMLKGNIIPDADQQRYLGFPSSAWLAVYANNIMLAKNNVNYGHLQVADGTTDAVGAGILVLGNGTPEGSDGNAYGMLRLYNKVSGYTQVEPKANASVVLTLPTSNGKLLSSGDFVVTGTADEATLTINLD